MLNLVIFTTLDCVCIHIRYVSLSYFIEFCDNRNEDLLQQMFFYKERALVCPQHQVLGHVVVQDLLSLQQCLHTVT